MKKNRTKHASSEGKSAEAAGKEGGSRLWDKEKGKTSSRGTRKGVEKRERYLLIRVECFRGSRGLRKKYCSSGEDPENQNEEGKGVLKRCKRPVNPQITLTV